MFSFPRRRFSMIVGPSGRGRTTLLNPIGCLDRPACDEHARGGSVQMRVT
jgi:ABC-type lipoprotein export system ATPase subunit